MKIITTLIYIIGFQYISFSQTNAEIRAQRIGQISTGKGIRFFISSKNQDISKVKLVPSAECRNIVITGIPASDAALISVNIELETKGSFVFKKDPALQIPENREVFIEDKLTGRVFNLKASEAYKFNVEKHVASRFVMHVLDKTNAEALLSMK